MNPFVGTQSWVGQKTNKSDVNDTCEKKKKRVVWMLTGHSLKFHQNLRKKKKKNRQGDYGGWCSRNCSSLDPFCGQLFNYGGGPGH